MCRRLSRRAAAPQICGCRADDRAAVVRRRGTVAALFRPATRARGEHACPQLSMGMSNDMEVAIEEGATWVRVGTALFGKRKKRVTVGFHSPCLPRVPVLRTTRRPYCARCRNRATSAPTPTCRRASISCRQQPAHREIYRQAIERPGVAVLHDAVLQHFFLGLAH